MEASLVRSERRRPYQDLMVSKRNGNSWSFDIHGVVYKVVTECPSRCSYRSVICLSLTSRLSPPTTASLSSQLHYQ